MRVRLIGRSLDGVRIVSLQSQPTQVLFMIIYSTNTKARLNQTVSIWWKPCHASQSGCCFFCLLLQLKNPRLRERDTGREKNASHQGEKVHVYFKQGECKYHLNKNISRVQSFAGTDVMIFGQMCKSGANLEVPNDLSLCCQSIFSKINDNSDCKSCQNYLF